MKALEGGDYIGWGRECFLEVNINNLSTSLSDGQIIFEHIHLGIGCQTAQKCCIEHYDF
jgi:hypothetical protein